MGKLLISFSSQQEAWLRGEAERTGLPGGVSEIVRRALDAYRAETPTMREPSIPEEVLAQIVEHRPHLAEMVNNLRAHPEMAQILEKRIADAYLAGTVHLSPLDTFRLAACSAGRAFGG